MVYFQSYRTRIAPARPPTDIQRHDELPKLLVKAMAEPCAEPHHVKIKMGPKRLGPGAIDV